MTLTFSDFGSYSILDILQPSSSSNSTFTFQSIPPSLHIPFRFAFYQLWQSPALMPHFPTPDFHTNELFYLIIPSVNKTGLQKKKKLIVQRPLLLVCLFLFCFFFSEKKTLL
ncbi:hypothetical protein CROQUDRAFT_451595 [Cronartium quercuum f. sp. fusiforme G11]|uniref:Uncharacterized protein n=1 Tax=Cronartium quercuum f. sp. fusiforme G11 TaxID=708437 RepID=A0A9P6NIU5_9BASI|nr:hypothetical protein CROQUDRAFT_451595 [Cronartium quercuum f. sp. fusiforme G11]